MNTRKFWPLDIDPEGEIYENVAWDLPGLRPGPRTRQDRVGQAPEKCRRVLNRAGS